MPFAFSKSAGKTLKQCVKSIQNWKQKKERNTWTMSDTSLVNSEHILHYILLLINIAEFEQMPVGPEKM